MFVFWREENFLMVTFKSKNKLIIINIYIYIFFLLLDIGMWLIIRDLESGQFLLTTVNRYRMWIFFIS